MAEYTHERVDRSTAVRRLLADGVAEWRREHALDRLAAGEVTLSRGAESADESVWTFAQLAREADVTWVGADGVEVDLESL